jgi:hypothetical protein
LDYLLLRFSKHVALLVSERGLQVRAAVALQAFSVPATLIALDRISRCLPHLLPTVTRLERSQVSGGGLQVCQGGAGHAAGADACAVPVGGASLLDRALVAGAVAHHLLS